MLSLLPGGELSGDLPPEDPLHPAPIPPAPIKVKALSMWNSLLIGVMAGFATSLGAFLFTSIRDRRRKP
jgi:hypothetical protein